ncbi:hypothetical protein ACET3Z_013911 [Daucus carota]
MKMILQNISDEVRLPSSLQMNPTLNVNVEELFGETDGCDDEDDGKENDKDDDDVGDRDGSANDRDDEVGSDDGDDSA